MSKSKAIGTRAETAVVNAMRKLGFLSAERHVQKGRYDEGDLWPCPGVIVQVKGGAYARAASDNAIERWAEEAEWQRKNASADVGFVVLQTAGIGEANAHRWRAVMSFNMIVRITGSHSAYHSANLIPVTMTLESACLVLRANGYGTELNEGNE